MISLQASLAVAGGLVLGGVILHGVWSTRRRARRFRARHETDGTEQAVEPSLEGELRDAEGAALAEPGLEAGRPAPRRLDALIDAIVPLALDGRVVAGEALLGPLPATWRAGSKPFLIEALPEGGSEWGFPVAGGRYAALQAGVQLANRSGALNEIEFSEFVAKVQRYADAVGAAPDFPDMAHEVARARELDQFASDHDAQLGFTIRARSMPWSAGFVQHEASQLGFVAGPLAGCLVLPAAAEGQAPVLELRFVAAQDVDIDPAQAVVDALQLSFEVPQVQRAEAPFQRLCEMTELLVRRMDGVVTDASGREISGEMVENIDADLQQLYETLEQHGLPSGSPEARRLFS